MESHTSQSARNKQFHLLSENPPQRRDVTQLVDCQAYTELWNCCPDVRLHTCDPPWEVDAEGTRRSITSSLQSEFEASLNLLGLCLKPTKPNKAENKSHHRTHGDLESKCLFLLFSRSLGG